MKKLIDSILGLMIAIGGWSLVETFPIYWLWNWLMPPIFGLKTISFLQAFGLIILYTVLFKYSIFSPLPDKSLSSENNSTIEDGYSNEGVST